MHELVIAKYLLHQVLEATPKEHSCRVVDIYLRIGVLRGVIDDWVRRYFVFAGRGTPAATATLHIEHVSAQVVCRCGALTPLQPGHLDDICCCACGSNALRLYSGQEFTLVGIAVASNEEENNG